MQEKIIGISMIIIGFLCGALFTQSTYDQRSHSRAGQFILACDKGKYTVNLVIYGTIEQSNKIDMTDGCVIGYVGDYVRK